MRKKTNLDIFTFVVCFIPVIIGLYEQNIHILGIGMILTCGYTFLGCRKYIADLQDELEELRKGNNEQ